MKSISTEINTTFFLGYIDILSISNFTQVNKPGQKLVGFIMKWMSSPSGARSALRVNCPDKHGPENTDLSPRALMETWTSSRSQGSYNATSKGFLGPKRSRGPSG